MKKSYSFYLMIGTLIVTMLILVGMKNPTLLYSPGEVTKKHSKLGCSDCHAPFKRVASESCSVADCHIAGKIGTKDAIKDLHNKVKDRDCLVCHTDHKGLKGKITIAFDHKELPKKVRCADCHITDGEKAHKGKYGDQCKACHTTKNWKAVTFSHDKVTKKACVDCHRADDDKAHKDMYGDQCKACHGTKDWKKVSFSHDRVTATVCSDCHKAAGEKAHSGKFGDACAACHNTNKWKEITFSHDKVTAKTCVDCHKEPKDDLHASSGNDCKTCHSVKAWKPAKLDHARYFPLDKEHMVACNKCHESPKNYKLYTCMNCHVHATRGIIKEHAEEGIRNYSDCLRCHRVYMNGRTYGTDKTGENESMIDDDDHKYRDKGNRRRDHDDDDDDDDDDDHDRKGLFKKWFGDDD